MLQQPSDGAAMARRLLGKAEEPVPTREGVEERRKQGKRLGERRGGCLYRPAMGATLANGLQWSQFRVAFERSKFAGIKH